MSSIRLVKYWHFGIDGQVIAITKNQCSTRLETQTHLLCWTQCLIQCSSKRICHSGENLHLLYFFLIKLKIKQSVSSTILFKEALLTRMSNNSNIGGKWSVCVPPPACLSPSISFLFLFPSSILSLLLLKSLVASQCQSCFSVSPPRSLLPSSFPFHVSIFQPRLFRGSPSCCLALPLLHVPNLMKRCRAEQVWLELPAMISSMCVYVCVCDRGQMCRCGRRSEKLVYCFSHVCQLWTALLIMDSSEENND